MYLCVEFQEEYKRLDKLCKEIFGTTEGVSEYIRQMEKISFVDSRRVYSWENDYRQLKHVRWVRNQLAHEVGAFDSGVCTNDDLLWVKNFYKRIISGEDPFTMIRKGKEEEIEREKEKCRREKLSVQKKDDSEKKSFWQRLKEKIRNIFS